MDSGSARFGVIEMARQQVKHTLKKGRLIYTPRPEPNLKPQAKYTPLACEMSGLKTAT